MGLNKFWEEVEIFENGSNSGYTPDCLAAVELKQDERYEYPGGYLCVLVLSKNPTHTFNVRRAMMKKKLTRSDLPLFAKRCEEMFRTFRARGRTLGMNVYLLEYEPESMKP